MQFPRRFLALAIATSFCLPNAAASGQAAPEVGFEGYVQLLAARARAQGVSEQTITTMTADLSPNQRVLDLDRSQPGQSSSSHYQTMAGYIARHVDRALANNGKSVITSLGPLGPEIEARYGVPLPMAVAIFGHETNYGNYTGSFDLARSLATLAWEGRRRELFAGEFIALLQVADTGVPRERLVGSWAGALGNPQFLPSVYLRLAADGNGDGKRDIWTSRADTVASIANYFHDAGWRPGQPWGVAAYVPAELDRESIKAKVVSPVCPRVHERHSRWMTVAEWRELGVRPQGIIGDDVMAALFEPDGPGKSAYLLTGNYRVILEYNCSNYYALSVGLLADEIAH